MSEYGDVLCAKCGNTQKPESAYELRGPEGDHAFCSRACLIEYIAPELKQAVVVKQWIPTPEDEERMSQ